MDLTARLATRRAAVLLAEVPGWAVARCAVEREVRARGWRLADSPADADVLAVCGRPGARLGTAVDLVWDQLPGPRARVDVDDPAGAAPALAAAAAHLADLAAQRRDAQARPAEPARGRPAIEAPPDGDDDEGDDMDMPMPGGIPLAGSGDDDQLADPDRLDLDVLHVPLGPVLPRWPAGLLLHTTLQGDLVVAARAEVLEPAGEPPRPGTLHGTPAGRWDAVATLLALTGRADGAAAAARLRDAALTGDVPRRDAERLAHRLRRSRLLRWSLRGLGTLPEGDAADRLEHWLTGADRARPTTLDQVADLVTGLDLAAVRLVVASLDLDTADRVHVPVESGT